MIILFFLNIELYVSIPFILTLMINNSLHAEGIVPALGCIKDVNFLPVTLDFYCFFC